MDTKRPNNKRRQQLRKKRRSESVRNRLESLEERVLLAVDFVPAPLGGTQPNRTDQELGLTSPTTQPAIALNPNDPGFIAVANETGLLQSVNAGATFDAAGNFQGLLGGGATAVGSSDLIYTSDGELKWAGLQIDAGGSQSIGVTFSAPGVFGVAAVPSQVGAESTRPIIVADTNTASDSPYAGYIYVAFVDESDNRVLLSRSVDGGLSWTTPVQVSDDSESNNGGNLLPVTPADVTVAPNGDVYVAYHYQSGVTAASGPDNQSNSDGLSGQVFVRRSTDGGLSFVSKTNAFPPGTADISVNVQTIAGSIDRARFYTQGARQPTILADPVREGHIYVVANDDPDNLHGSGDEGDIVFARSDDFGETWDRRTIDIRSSFQVMPSAEIDEFGNIVIAWYDTRRGNLMGGEDFRLDVYATYSTDGGSNWADAFRINDDFNPIDPVTPNTDIVFVGDDRDGDGRLEDDGDETYSLGNFFGVESFGGTGYVVWNGNERVIGLPSAHQVFFDVFPIYGTLHVTGLDTDDTFLVRTMPDNPDFLEVFVNGQRQYAGLRESLIGGIQVDGLAGNDRLVVDWTVGNADPVPPGGIFFQGGIPEGGSGVGDTLDLLTGDRTIDFQNEQSDLDSGLFVVGDSAAVSFDNVERTQIGTTDYLRPDLLEVNDTLATATVLGSEPAVTLRGLTIHDMGDASSNDDFFRITASQTGFLIVNALFDHSEGDMSVMIHDSRGNAIRTAASTTDNEQIIVPVVAQESYTIHVFGVDGAINTYALEVENFAAPPPQAVILDPLSDSGMMNNDGVTADVTPRFTIQADLSSLTDQGIVILDADQATAGDTPGAAVFVTIRDQIAGTLESGYATPVGDDIFSYLAGDLPDGLLIISASVHVFDERLVIDPTEPTNTLSDPLVGSSLESTPLTILLDTVVPVVTSPQLLPSSDSGMSRTDKVTNIMQPAFVGTTGPNEKVRIFANGLIVGESQAGADGRWEITIEPLAEGIYDITNQVTDLAGNFGESNIVNRIQVDKTAPNTPFLDLTDGSDTGLSSTDNVTGDNTLTFTMTTTDLPFDQLSPFGLKYRLYVRPEGGAEVLIYDSSTDSSIPAGNSQGGFTDLEFLSRTLDELPDGTHNFKLEVEDRAGNISEDFLLDVTIDTSLPSPLTLDLITESDTGMDSADDVTRFTNPTFSGTGDVGGAVTLFAGDQIIGSGTVGGDLSDGIEGNGLGAWEITSGTLDDGVYTITAVIENENGSVSSEPLTVEVDTLQPNTPLLDLVPSSDSGHSENDDITNTINPTFNMATIDPNQDAHVSPFNYKYRIFVRLDSGVEELVYDSVTDDSFPNSATDGVFTNLENLRRTIERGLPDGTHNFKLEVEDRAGNISEDFLLNVTVDTELLTSQAGVTIDMIDASDAGMDNRDNTTKINEPAFTGTAEVGSEVSLFANGILVGTTTVGSDETDFVSGDGLGAWEITSEPLDDGPYEFIAHVEDWAGNFERSDSVTVDIDTTPPNTPFLDVVGATRVSQALEVTTSNNLTLTMTTEDPDAGDRIDPFNLKYRIYLRPERAAEALIYDSVVDPSILAGNLSGGFTDLEFLQTVIRDLPSGEHNFKLEVEDRAGNVSDDYLLTVRIEDPLVPTGIDAVAIDLISSSDSGMSDVDNVTNINQPAFNGVGTVGAEVRLINDAGEIIGTTTVGGDASNGILNDGLGRWEITSEPLDDGIYTVSAELEDQFGNTASTGTVTFEVDTLAPNTPYLDLLPTDDTGLDNEDNVTSQLLPTFHMATLDPNQDSHLSEFNYKFRLFVRLDSGVERLVYDSVADGTFPASAIQDGFISLENLRREIDLGVPDGVHNFKLEVEDRAGNISEDFLLNVTIDAVLDAPNGVVGIDLQDSSDTGMDNRDNVTKTDMPTFSGIAEVGSRVAIIANGLLIGSGVVGSDETDFVPGDGLGAWEVTVGPLDEGVYEVIAHVEDLAGNFLRSDSVAVEVDTTQPNTPFLDLLNDNGHSDHDNITGEASLEFNFTSEDPEPIGGHVSDFNFKYRIYVRPEGGAESLVYNSVTDVNIDPTEISEGFTSLLQLQATLGPFPDGIHNFKLEVEDRAGNISEDFLLTVQIDSTLEGTPGVDLITSSDTGMFDDDNVTGINEPAFTGVAEMGSTVRLRANGQLVGVAEVQSDDSDGAPGDGLGEWEITSEPLDDGIYEITAEVEDWAGNIETSGSLTIEVDTLQPNTPYLDLIPTSDSGLADDDNETFVVIPTVNMATIDPNQDDHLSQFNYKYRLFVRHDSGVELLLYDSAADGDSFTASSFQDGFTSLENLRRAIDLGVPDGVHNFKLEVEDRAGNISEDFLLNVTIDTVLDTPFDGVGIDLINASDTGMSERDNVTNINAPTFAGLAEVGATVTIFANGQVVGTGTVGSDETDFVPDDGLGAWEVTVDPLADGIYDVLAHVEDLAGNFLRSDSITIEVDTTEPNTPHLDLLNDTGHSAHDEITQDSTLDFNFTTEDPSPTGGHLQNTNFKYRIFVRPEGGEETLVYNSVVDTNIDPASILEGFTDLQQLQATLGPFPDGIHNFKLEVEDRAGNISQDFLLTVEIDSVLDGDLNIDMLASSDSGMFDDDNVTNIDEPAFTGVAEMGSTVRLRANGRLIGEAEVHSDDSDGVPGDGLGEWEITSEPLDDGIYEITAEVEDWAGNVETTGSLTIEVDTLQSNTPYLDLLPSSDSGLHDDDEVTNVVIPSLNMATIDPNQDNHLSEFNYKYRIFVRHDSGVESLLYDSSADGASFAASSFQDGFTTLENLRRTLDLGVPDGVHNLKLEVEDRAGNISEDFLLNVTVDTVLEAPNQTISIDMLGASDTGMNDGDNVTNKDQPAFTGVAEVDSMVTLFADGQIIGVGRVGSDETDGVPGDGLGAWEITVEPLADGIYDVTAHVEDLAGNSLLSEGLQIEVDTRAPNTPFLDLVSSSDTGIGGRDEVTSDNSLTFNMTTTDESPEGHLIDQNYKFRLYVRPEGGAEVLVYDSVADGAIPPAAIQDGLIDLNFLSRTLPELPDGEHNFKLEVEDRAGNISDDFLLNVTIDTTLVAPTIDLIAASDSGMSDLDNVTNVNAPTFAGTGDVGDKVTLFANGVIVGTGFVGSDQTDFVEGNGRGAWQVTINPLDDGIYDVLAHIEDEAGNFQRTEPIQIEVDTLEPNTPHLDLVTSSDSGHSNHDNITGVTTPTFTFTTEDPNQDAHISPFNYKYRLYVRPEGGIETLVYNSVGDAEIVASAVEGSFTSLEFLQRTLGQLPDGIHNFKLEVEDRAGNISPDVTLTVEVDSTLPDVGQIDLLAVSDSGMSASDNVTNKDQPAFAGLGTPGTQVRLFANGQFVGTTEVGSDESDGFIGNNLGIWEITSEPLVDDVYTITATFEDWAGNISGSNSLTIEVDTLAPNTPFLDLLEPFDSGRNDDDNITNAEILSFSATTEDPNADKHATLFPGGENFKFRIYARPESGSELLVYDSVTDVNLVDRVDGFTSLQQIFANVDGIPEGLHNFKLEVEDRAGNISHDFLQNVLVDRQAFEGTCSLHVGDDTGIWGIESTFGDGITGTSSPPTFTGTAEANNIVTLLIDGEVAGTTVVAPFDGDNAFTEATWTIESSIMLTGGETIEVIYEDPAGNRVVTNCGDDFEIVIDTIGPRIENVTRDDATLTSVFDPKPAGGPDPLIESIVIHYSDGPERPDNILYDAVLLELALEEGNYRVVGDANGNIPISSVDLVSTNPGPGTAFTSVRLNFAIDLPDDRYTLTVSERIADAAGNPLDGESGANGPFEGNAGLVSTSPIFPTGDGNHGGDFLARFTVDSRPEIGVWSAGSVYVDTNGNFGFDQDNLDYVNRDIAYTVGFTSDDIFAGNFAGPNGVADGYDKLAAYGRFGGWMDGTFRWWVDLDNDGVIDIDVEDPSDVNGLPLAGNFDGNEVNGDEVGLYTGNTWHLDTDGDYLVDFELASELIGYPVSGDFDDDGFEDLATWADDTFMVDLANGVAQGWDGVADATFRFGFIGVRERPVVADMDQDGYDDMGLWVPDRGGITDRDAGEWYWLVSGGQSVLNRITESPDPVGGTTQEIQFRPVPFGNDIFAQFGDEFAIPIVGNFDPPTLPAQASVSQIFTNPLNPMDVNNDGHVTPRDALIAINHLNRYGSTATDELEGDDMPYVDTNNDDFVSSLDVLRVINYINRETAAEREPEVVDVIAPDVAQAVFVPNLVDSDADDDDEDEAEA